jgi:hypothetical protein
MLVALTKPLSKDAGLPRICKHSKPRPCALLQSQYCLGLDGDDGPPATFGPLEGRQHSQTPLF